MKIVVAVFFVVGLLMGGGLIEAVYAQETGTAEEEEISQEDLLKARGTVHGKRGRRNFKTAYWAAGLEGDMKEIYEAYGYPSARYREEKMGRIEEKWTYIEAGKRFTFRDGKLLNERDYVPSMTPAYTVK
jgi:hypothetical protein